MERFITQIGQSRAILILIMVIGAVLGYFSYSDIESETVPTDAGAKPRRDSIESFANFKIDLSILEDEAYKSLEIFGENPVDPGVTGERKNPFIPID